MLQLFTPKRNAVAFPKPSIRDNKMKISRHLLCCILLLATSQLFAQNSNQKYRLKQLLDSALQNNYLLQANEKNTLIKQAEIELLKN
jgi:hypothetical protein